MKRDSNTPGSRSNDTDKAAIEALKAAIKKTKAEPAHLANWDELEELATALQHPEEVMALYQKVLAPGFPVEKVTLLVERALRFHDEWFAGDTQAAVAILERANELDPGSDVALDRLTILLSVTQDWEPLLAAYDRTLAAIPDGPRRRRLLQEAATVARDSSKLDRASNYLRAIIDVTPGAAEIAAELERLLEEQGDHAGLVSLLERRLATQSGTDLIELRERLAKLYLEKLGQVERALVEIEALGKSPDLVEDTLVCALAERILENSTASAEIRRRALSVLRARYEQSQRPERLVSSLRTALAFAADDERRTLIREAVDLLEHKGDWVAAREQLIELLSIEPAQTTTRARLKYFAEVTDAPESYVRGLLVAAQATSDEALKVSLWLEAAQIDEQRQGGVSEAIRLYQQVIESALARSEQVLTALRRLVALLVADSQTALRLEYLERQAGIEPSLGVRRGLLGEAAELAANLGQLDRALGLWEKRLHADPNDRKALARSIELLEQTDRIAELQTVLARRANSSLSWTIRRGDLLRMAVIERDRLKAPEKAIDIALRILKEHPEDREAINLVLDLLTTVGRHQEFVTQGTAVGERDRQALVALYVHLGDTCRGPLNDPAGAARFYSEALSFDPINPSVRRALLALAQETEGRGFAVAGLVKAYEATADWKGILALLPLRLPLAANDAERARLLAEAARIEEKEAHHPEVAFAHLSALFPLQPKDVQIESELLRLADVTKGYDEVASAITAAVAALPEGSPRAIQLKLQLADLHEEKRADKPAALAEYSQVLLLAPTLPSARLGVVRIGAELGLWEIAVAAAFFDSTLPGDILTNYLPLLEKAAAKKPKALMELGSAITTALEQRTDLPAPFVRTVFERIADYAIEEDQRGNWQRMALARASAADPLHLPTLRKLAQAQWSLGGKPFYDTLMQIASLAPHDLDPLVESLAVAERLDPKLRHASLERLYEAGARLMRKGQGAEGKVTVGEAVVRAARELAELWAASRERADGRRAVELLLEVSRLSIPADIAQTLRTRAGELAMEVDKTLAREILRRAVEDDPRNRVALKTLGRLYEEMDLYSDLLTLRKRELDYLANEEERLALRLEIARLGELVEKRTERFEMLLSNLEECPGHAPTLKALEELLRARGRYLELADILTTQARKLENLGDLMGASRRWYEVATLFESQLVDEAQAISAYEKVVSLSQEPKALEALARLFESLGEPLQAANWLEQRLSMGETAEKQQAVTRLAELYLKGGQKHRAVITLERVLSEDPKVDGLWVFLAKLHRESEHFEALVQVLNQRAMQLNDAEALLAIAHEVQSLCKEKLHDPVRAIPVLERALTLVPSDRALRFSLAEGLSLAGRFADARHVLEAMLEGFGRRQSRERANLHLQIARVARAEKDLPLAAQHLEQAAQVLLDNIEVQLALAEVAEERGEIERAEKGYRALLVLARRSHDSEVLITAGEVHLRMRRLYLRQNQTVQAAANLEAAISRALHDAFEARRIQAALLAEGEYDRLLDLIAKRRSQATQVVDEVVLMGEQAMALEAMGKGADAFALLMEGLSLVPNHPGTHTLARQLAKRLNQPQRYLEAVAQATEKLRRSDDAAELADLFLRSAEAAEEDLNDPNRALEFLHRTEQTNERLPEVLGKIVRLSAQVGDTVESRRATTQLQRLQKSAATIAEKAEVAYRLAEGLLGQEATRDEGLDALSLAVETCADLPRAMTLVQNAKVPDSALIRVLPVYEKVARASKNERLLLDFYERRAVLPDTLISDVRDGVELAVTLGEGERAERLLAQAIAIGHRTSLHEAVWAVLDLSRRLRARGELAKSAEVLLDARDEWTNPRLTPTVRETARAVAADPKTTRLAAQLYEQLHVLYPADRDIWEPLANLYSRLEDPLHLEALTRDLTAKLMGRNDRSAVRMAWVRYLLSHGDKSETIASTLRDILMEEPGHLEAITLLADYYEKRAEVGEAVTLLSDTLANAESPLSGAGRATLARRLGDLVKRGDPTQAKEVYRSALATSLPDVSVKRSLQVALLELLDENKDGVERANLLEDILLGENGESAATHALDLFELRLRLNDDLGAKRVLEIGYERAPGNSALVEQLGLFYTQRELWGDAVNLFLAEAAHTADPEQATVLYRKVARIQRGKLGDARAASQTLRQATIKNPTDLDLIQELAETMIAAGDLLLAIASVSEILSATQATDLRIALLRLRADLTARNRDDEGAVRDLEEALTLGGQGLEIDLAAALSRVAGRASAAEDMSKAREATLRLAEVLRESGDAAQSDQVLFRWIEATPGDREVLYQLRDRFMHEEKWEEAVNIWERLVHLEEGEEKVDAVLTLSELFEHLGRPEEALPWLNGVLTSMPDHRGLKARLADFYDATGNAVEAARLRYSMAESEPDETVRFNVFLQIGQSLLAIGQGAEAALALERAIDLQPADRNTKVLLLDAYTLAGRFDRAAVILEHLLAGAKTIRAEELALLYQRQSRLCLAMGDRDGQLAAMKKALDTDRKSIAIANELADLAEAMGDDDLALRALRVVAASPGKDGKTIATAYLRQARIAHRAHDRSRAIIFVKRALQEDPDLEDAKALLEQLR